MQNKGEYHPLEAARSPTRVKTTHIHSHAACKPVHKDIDAEQFTVFRCEEKTITRSWYWVRFRLAGFHNERRGVWLQVIASPRCPSSGQRYQSGSVRSGAPRRFRTLSC